MYERVEASKNVKLFQFSSFLLTVYYTRTRSSKNRCYNKWFQIEFICIFCPALNSPGLKKIIELSLSLTGWRWNKNSTITVLLKRRCKKNWVWENWISKMNENDSNWPHWLYPRLNRQSLAKTAGHTLCAALQIARLYFDHRNYFFFLQIWSSNPFDSPWNSKFFRSASPIRSWSDPNARRLYVQQFIHIWEIIPQFQRLKNS